MPNASLKRYELLELLYKKAKEGALKWKIRGENSYEAFFGDFRVHADVRLHLNTDPYVIYVFGKNADLVDSFRRENVESTRKPQVMDDVSNYADLIRNLFDIAESSVDTTELDKALDALQKL